MLKKLLSQLNINAHLPNWFNKNILAAFASIADANVKYKPFSLFVLPGAKDTVVEIQ